MSAYTPRGIMAELHSHVWEARHLAHKIRGMTTADRKNRWSAIEVEGVLNAVLDEVWRMRELERAKAPNQRNLRQAEEFALKAKIAKATGDSLHAAASVPDAQSHK